MSFPLKAFRPGSSHRCENYLQDLEPGLLREVLLYLKPQELQRCAHSSKELTRVVVNETNSTRYNRWVSVIDEVCQKLDLGNSEECLVNASLHEIRDLIETAKQAEVFPSPSSFNPRITSIKKQIYKALFKLSNERLSSLQNTTTSSFHKNVFAYSGIHRQIKDAENNPNVHEREDVYKKMSLALVALNEGKEAKDLVLLIENPVGKILAAEMVFNALIQKGYYADALGLAQAVSGDFLMSKAAISLAEKGLINEAKYMANGLLLQSLRDSIIGQIEKLQSR